MESGQTVTVFGAYGHTGRFVVAELLERGFVPVLSGRDAEQAEGTGGLAAGTGRPAGLGRRPGLARPRAGRRGGRDQLRRAVRRRRPAPVIEAALRAGIPYVDVAAEIEANLDTFAHFAEPRRGRGNAWSSPRWPSTAGFGDLLVTAAMGEWTAADEAHIAYGLSSWHPTAGTRAAGAVSRERRGGRRVRYTGGRLEYREDAPADPGVALPRRRWARGPLSAEFTMADVVTVPSHLAVPEVRTYMTVEAAGDLVGRGHPGAERGRRARSVRTRPSSSTSSCAPAAPNDAPWRGARTSTPSPRRWWWRPSTASSTGTTRTIGVASAGEIFDAPDFLRALSPHISFELRR